MKDSEQKGKSHLTIKDYDYHTFSPDFGRMQADLMHTGLIFFTLGSIMLFLLLSAWYQEPAWLTLAGFTLGGIIGSVLPWIGIRQSKLLGFHIGEPKHFSGYEHRLQIVIWKFRKKSVLLLTAPYFLYLLYLAINTNLPIGEDTGNSFVVLILATICLFGFSMGILSWQVYWLLDREIRKHEKKSKA